MIDRCCSANRKTGKFELSRSYLTSLEAGPPQEVRYVLLIRMNRISKMALTLASLRKGKNDSKNPVFNFFLGGASKSLRI